MEPTIPEAEDKSTITSKPPYNWQLLATKIGIVLAFITLMGFIINLAIFVWSFHIEVITLSKEQGIIEGQMKILVDKKAFCSQ